MTKRLSKTATELLRRMNERGHVAIHRGSGRGPAGGRVRFGGREWRAGIALIEAKLATLKGDITRSAHTQRGYTVWSSEALLIPAPQAR